MKNPFLKIAFFSFRKCRSAENPKKSSKLAKLLALQVAIFCYVSFDITEDVQDVFAKTCPPKISTTRKIFTELRKKMEYESRVINVEKSRTLNPLVFACTSGAGSSTTKLMTRLAAKINEKDLKSCWDDKLCSVFC